MGNSRARGSRTSRSGAKPRQKTDSRTTTPLRDERVDAKFTFVVHGGEVLAIFRAIRDLEGKWQKEMPYIDGSGRAVLNCYAHVGQHGVCDPALLKCRRAKPEEYLPLKRELEEIVGYNVDVVQHGKLRLKEETGYAAVWFDDYDCDFGVYKIFRDRGAALDYLALSVAEEISKGNCIRNGCHNSHGNCAHDTSHLMAQLHAHQSQKQKCEQWKS